MVEEEDRHARRVQALAESGQLFAEASTGLERLLDVVARRFSVLVGEATNIRLIEGNDLVPAVTYHPDSKVNEYLREHHDSIPLIVGQGISGHVLATGEPYFEPALDIEKLKQHIAPRFIPIFEEIGITGMIVVRLRARGINLGYLSLFRTSTERPPYTLEDLSLAQDLALRAAMAIDNSRILDGLERRVAERTQALETANHELEAFAYSVSHDLRSPLRAIEGFSTSLEEDYGEELSADARRMLGVVRKNARHMSQLLEGLLRLSRLGHRGLEPVTQVDMRELVEPALASIRASYPNVPIDVRMGELPLAIGNAELLRQVWINLLDNAVKYSGKQAVARLEIDGQRAGGEVRYSVTDHGAGFDPKDSGRLFGVFERLHSSADFEGTGVGLALVNRIVRRHGGHVWAEGSLGAGATFGFGLPERGPSRR